MVTHLRIGTRKSPLALAQAEQVQAMLELAHPQLAGRTELVTFVTSGDRYHDKVLADIGGKGLFTKEIEEALLSGTIDCAVHSMKDMQTVLPARLVIACTPQREDPRDALVGKGVGSLRDLPKEAIVGTSSLRRSALVKYARPDVQVLPFRGNVATRLEKLERGEAHATLLAVAGLKRLGMVDSVAHTPLAVEEFLPAIAQGVLALECCEDRGEIREILASLTHRPTYVAAECERAFLRALDGSCRTPIAGYAEPDHQNRIAFRGLVAAPDGTRCEAISGMADMADATSLGRALGEEMRARKGIIQMLGICA